MAPRIIEDQTNMIVNCLFEDPVEKPVFQCKRSFTETDGIVLQGGEFAWRDAREKLAIDIKRFLSQTLHCTVLYSVGPQTEESFDPRLIAEKLRSLGDDYDETVLQPLMKELQKAAVDKMQTAFKSSVEHLCESWVAQSGGVAVEPQLLKAAVTLGLYAKRKCPDLSAVVQGAMAAFINTNLAPWVSQQGGWAQVTLE